jgi:uncharacterized protein with ATP-grasp and redox domains
MDPSVSFFQLGQDPFGYQKSLGLDQNGNAILNLAGFLQRSVGDEDLIWKTLEKGFYFSLWGNQADLSLWPADSPDNPKHGSQESLKRHLLANDIQMVLEHLTGGGKTFARLDLMLDNAGFELITDLGLADILLGGDLVEKIVLHAKAHPTFVSDVIPEDIRESIRFLTTLSDQDAQSFGNRLEDYLYSGRMEIQSNLFWNSPLPMWKLPDDIARDWEGSSLVICKGDANYRRILGDLHWDFEVPFKQVVDYLPTPLVALRALKAELAVGLDADRIQTVLEQDSNWMVNGRWGVIHFTGG